MTRDMKEDNGKPRMDLLDPDFLYDLSMVLTLGAQKYAPYSFQEVKDPINRYYAACMRHLLAIRKGLVYDHEDSLPHIAHAAANLMFLYRLMIRPVEKLTDLPEGTRLEFNSTLEDSGAGKNCRVGCKSDDEDDSGDRW